VYFAGGKMVAMPSNMFGDFIEMGNSEDYLMINFPFTTLSIQDRWRNNSLSADFIANYWETFFPMSSSPSQYTHAKLSYTIRYIANELLENAVKFSYELSRQPIKMWFSISDIELRFYINNSINPQNVGQFQQYIQQLLTEDHGKLYFRQIESNAGDKNNAKSCLGLLTILHDYHAQLAWKFDTVHQEPEVVIVTTMARLRIGRCLKHKPDS
jgi:hypothetical protein